MPPARVFYLHGFASSAESTKAAYFGERFAALHVPFRCPDFNEPDFTVPHDDPDAARSLDGELADGGGAAARPR